MAEEEKLTSGHEILDEQDLIDQDFCEELIEFVKKEAGSLWQKQEAKLEKKLNDFINEVKNLNCEEPEEKDQFQLREIKEKT
jgi:hypothetical protein